MTDKRNENPKIAYENSQELMKLFCTIDATRPEGKAFVLQFVASLPGEGTTTVASGFAEIAAKYADRQVLVIDCAGVYKKVASYHEETLINAYRRGESFHTWPSQNKECENLSKVRLTNAFYPLMDIGGEELTRVLQELKEKFSVIILDCPAAMKNPDSVALSRYCDGTILVVRAEYARTAVVASVRNNIRLVGGEVVGVVFNGRGTYIPNWLYRWLFVGSGSNKYAI